MKSFDDPNFRFPSFIQNVFITNWWYIVLLSFLNLLMWLFRQVRFYFTLLLTTTLVVTYYCPHFTYVESNTKKRLNNLRPVLILKGRVRIWTYANLSPKPLFSLFQSSCSVIRVHHFYLVTNLIWSDPNFESLNFHHWKELFYFLLELTSCKITDICVCVSYLGCEMSTVLNLPARSLNPK